MRLFWGTTETINALNSWNLHFIISNCPKLRPHTHTLAESKVTGMGCILWCQTFRMALQQPVLEGRCSEEGRGGGGGG